MVVCIKKKDMKEEFIDFPRKSFKNNYGCFIPLNKLETIFLSFHIKSVFHHFYVEINFINKVKIQVKVVRLGREVIFIEKFKPV